ncbi:GTP cyclohydrolase II [Nocardia sp. NPDC046763]|uniref:GTP cyclohydrolase II n=1 Tax=Nocardia sp. NPDC046763 TaxID=3155256 RepID=UPI0033DF0096
MEVRIVEVNHNAIYGHALIFGNPRNGCLVRVHSRCLYGDALASEDCDCGPELMEALDQIQCEGHGVLVYLEQEGRGAGLLNKARGYRLSQERGIDTFASYRALGLPPDSRTYAHAAETLLQLGLQSIRLLTNNPDKAEALREEGLVITTVPLVTEPRNQSVRDYLAAKRVHRGHRIPRWWWLHRWSNRVCSAAALLLFGLASAALAIAARPAAIAVWERAVPSAVLPAGGFAACAVGFAAAAGLVAGRYLSPRRRLLAARVRTLNTRNRLR